MVRQVKILPARELVASEIRKAILTGKFQAGEELTQDKVAEMLGVSRMPVREAINILANEGLLITAPNKSAVVSEIPSNYIKEHFEARILLECEATERASTRFENLDEITSIHERYGEAINANDMEQVHYFNQEFHYMIWDVAENRKIKAFLLQLWNGLPMTIDAKLLDKTHEEHESIMQAFREKDPIKAKQAMRIHLESSMRRIADCQQVNINI
jgi:DNA-binding GntR family transcriptional regulator